MAASTTFAASAPRERVRTEPIRVALIEPHRAMRESLRALLDDAGIDVVAEADSPGQVPPRTLQERTTDVLVLDVSYFAGSALSAIGALGRSAAQVPIVAITMHADPAFAGAAIRAGARAVVLKDLADSQLAEAVQAAA
jgi:DNA-binding NarL/FixJ family response regulator